MTGGREPATRGAGLRSSEVQVPAPALAAPLRGCSNRSAPSTGGAADGPDLSEPRADRRPDRDDRLRLDRPGHPAADRAPLRLRPPQGHRHRPHRRPPHLPRAARRPLHPHRRNPRELQGSSHPALPRRPRLLRQPLGRHRLARPPPPLPRARRPLHRHRRRALGRPLLRPLARAGRPHQLRPPRDRPRREARQPRRHHRRLLLRRQPRHGLLAPQGSPPPPRHRPRRGRDRPEGPRRLGPPDAVASASRASTSPSATPRRAATPSPCIAS